MRVVQCLIDHVAWKTKTRILSRKNPFLILVRLFRPKLRQAWRAVAARPPGTTPPPVVVPKARVSCQRCSG